MKHRKKLKKIEREIRALGGTRYTVTLPAPADWGNPGPALTAEQIEQKLSALEPGTTLHWAGVGSFYCFATDEVIEMDRSPLISNYFQKVNTEDSK